MIRQRKVKRQTSRDREEGMRKFSLKKKLTSVKLLQYFVENNNSDKLKRLDIFKKFDFILYMYLRIVCYLTVVLFLIKIKSKTHPTSLRH